MTLLAEVVRVECYAGSRCEETPRRVLLGGRWEELSVLGQWVTEDAGTGSRLRYFRVATERGEVDLLYRDERLDTWFWQALRAPGGRVAGA